MTDPNNTTEKLVYVACDGSTHDTREKAILHGWETLVRNELVNRVQGLNINVYDLVIKDTPEEYIDTYYKEQVNRIWRGSTEHFIHIIKQPKNKEFRNILKSVIEAIENTL